MRFYARFGPTANILLLRLYSWFNIGIYRYRTQPGRIQESSNSVPVRGKPHVNLVLVPNLQLVHTCYRGADPGEPFSKN